MKVRGLLVEGKNGEEYVLGIGPRSSGIQRQRPTIWRVDSARYEPLEKSRAASSTIRDRLDLAAKLKPGLTHDDHVKWAVLEALSKFTTQFFSGCRW
jgi:hypothetical protein